MTDAATIERIRALAIPPAWTDVWICRTADGHLQAAGTDAAGRRQYLYHRRWRERQDTLKFRRVEAFAAALPGLRATVDELVAEGGRHGEISRSCAIAVAVRLLDRATFRIGSEAYADRNGSFGLATIRKSHVHVEGSTLTFDYVAKGGHRRVQSVDDPAIVPIVERMKRRRTGGLELLAFREAGRWRDLRSADINAYLKEELGSGHSAKDFRTWHATVLAALEIARADAASTASTSKDRLIAATVREVAAHLGNTPAVCRASYIDPRVFDRFREGATVAGVLARIDPTGDDAREAVERAVLALLTGTGGAERAA